MHQAGRHVGRHADVAVSTAQHQCHGGRVVARIHGKALGDITDEPLGAFDVAGGFFDANDARHLRQAQHGVVQHVAHRAAGHVVQHDGKVARGFGNRLEVLVLAFLCGLVVVGHHLQLAVGTHAACELGQFNGLGGGVGTTARHDGHALGGLLHGHADDLAVFFDVDSGRFARGAHYANAVGAFGNVPVDQFAQGWVVHATVLVHGSDEGDDAAGEGDGRRCHVRSGKR